MWVSRAALLLCCLSSMNALALAFTRIASSAIRRSVHRRETTRGTIRLCSSSTSDTDTTSNTEKDTEQGNGKTKSSSLSDFSKKSKKTRSRIRREEQERLGESQTKLTWETYDYSLNPKQDNRFSNDGASIAANIGLDVEEEAREDRRHAEELRDRNNAYLKLDPELVTRAIDALEPWINDDRLKRVSGVLKQRTKHSKFLFENPSNPSNVWACLRTIDSFGLQNVDLVIESGRYAGKQAVSQKKGMRVAMGSAQWLTLTNHATTKEAIEQIRDVQGYKIYASDLNPNSKDVRDIDWDADDRPVCIVMGNEDRGISDEMRELADETFTLPMCGFAESFNLSVATSITLAHMSASSYHCNKEEESEKQRKGPLRPGDLSEHEYNCLYLKGLLNSLPKKKMATALLKQANVELPKALGEL
ncbi:unnamed protein product [Pseudo-nitzschia multistriata]|uniref:tRNA/rRNA methyltransferase SpoU type domain-containing protein n=1 Tax=Pseudo-nitzschia multistriata TaxID=183589 RepID=A0A448Z9V4_9STRA|nr:unnamed protein product [Pseudo-nitzschia multistriata]